MAILVIISSVVVFTVLLILLVRWKMETITQALQRLFWEALARYLGNLTNQDKLTQLIETQIAKAIEIQLAADAAAAAAATTTTP